MKFILKIQNDVKPILLFVIVCSAIFVLDSTLVRIFSNVSSEPSPIINTYFFMFFVVIYALISYILIRYSKQDFLLSKYRSHRVQRICLWSIIAIQLIICIILASIILQLIVYRSYNVLQLQAIIYISHFTAVAFLTFLTYQFLNWFRSINNYLVLLYSIAFSILVVNILISLIFFTLASSWYDPVLRLRSIRIALMDTSIPLNIPSILVTTYDYLSVGSFVFAWIPTVILLKTYALRFGRAKYWLMVTIPLIYFIFPFLLDELGTFDELRLQYGREFNLIYNIFFSPYRQVGGVLFGIAFFLTAMKIKRKDLQSLVITSGIGMMFIFGSTVIHGLAHIVAPPFGIVTISIMSLASYMLLVGIFASSRELSRDALVRRELGRLAGERVSLLRNTGAAELEKTLIKSIKPIMDKTILAEDTTLQYPTDQEDYKEMVKEVLAELKTRKKI